MMTRSVGPAASPRRKKWKEYILYVIARRKAPMQSVPRLPILHDPIFIPSFFVTFPHIITIAAMDPIHSGDHCHIDDLSPARRAARRDSKVAHAAAALWANCGEVSPMSKGVCGYTDSKSDHCELRVNRAGKSPMRQGVFEYTDFKNDYCELRVEQRPAPPPFPRNDSPISADCLSCPLCCTRSSSARWPRGAPY